MNIRNFVVAIAAFVLLGTSLVAQPDTYPAGLDAAGLRTWLKTNWYDGHHKQLGYNDARKQMYGKYDKKSDGKVYCVYTGYSENGSYSTSLGQINCEHTVPQSFFNSNEPMKSDVHHLFPTHSSANSARGNNPFAEHDDNTATLWYGIVAPNTYSTAKPSADKFPVYSKQKNSQFEPREDHKGNVARAVFYFYTMYPTQAGSIASVAPIATLYQWHVNDPVDAQERRRDSLIAQNNSSDQGNHNPYIRHPEWVAPAWGIATCTGTPTVQVSALSITNITTNSFKINYTPGNGDTRLIAVREGSAVSLTPSGAYASGVNTNFASATDQGSGNKVVYYGAAATVTVTGLTPGATYHVQAFEACSQGNAYNTTNAPTTSAKTDTAGSPPTGVTSINENFETACPPAGWITFSDSSNKNWTCKEYQSNKYMQMNGYKSDKKSADYLITPAINLSAINNPHFAFKTKKGFDGPNLKVYWSADFNGDTNKIKTKTATWTEITGFALSPHTGTGYAADFTPSGNINLSSITAPVIHIAFKYYSTGSGTTNAGAEWQVDDVVLQSGPLSVAKELQSFEVNVYPNPAQSEINIEISGKGLSTLRLIDLTGKTVIEQITNSELVKLDVGHLNKGIYLLDIQNNGTRKLSKVLID